LKKTGQTPILIAMRGRLFAGIVILTAPSLACGDAPPSLEGGSTGESGESGSGSGDGDGDGSTEEGESGETGEPQSCAELPGPWDAGYSIAKKQPLPGDPQVGLDALLEEDYVSCGIPWELFGIMKPFIGSFASGPTLDWRSGKNAQVPVGWNVVEMGDGSELVVPNCFGCHAAEFDGELILGLGRHDGDFTTDLGSLMQLAPTLPPLNDAGAAFNKFLERFSVIGPPSTMLTIGTNPAIMYAVVLVSRRNPFTLAWLDEPLVEIPPGVLVPADPPPWWRAKKKATHFINGMSRGDHRGTMILASSLCTDTAAEASEVLDYFIDIQAWMATLEPPTYTRAVDEVLAAEGAELFECRCAGCHGTYSDDPEAETYPNLLVPLELIGTDPVMASYAANELNYLEEWFKDSYYGTVTELETADPFVGYVAPPLDGVWASAPYFHNGSVPTLELVLDSSRRPTHWRREDYESTSYDWEALGWRWNPVPYGRDEAPLGERIYIYDTTQPGHANTGHTFGDDLGAHERAAVLEYLKTI
jgi:mono/diheme cytochrome c family protein